MGKFNIIDQINSSSNLLSLPQVLSELLAEIEKEDFSADSLAAIILKDPSLTGRILKMANSSFYKRSLDIKTVNQAISMMGVNTVKCLALSSAIFHPEKISEESGVDAQRFFEYILSVATASRMIAEQIDSSTEEAFVSGLLHDIGLMFLIHHYPKEYSRIINAAEKTGTLTEAEKNVFGLDHTTISCTLAKAWRLPKVLCEAIDAHHNRIIGDSTNTLQNIVRLAVALSQDRFTGYSQDLEDRLFVISEYAELLGVSQEQIDQISSELLKETLKYADYLGVDIGNVEDMLIRANQEIWKTYVLVENLFREREELSKSLLEEERSKGAMESKNIAMATMSHYMNNAVMAIFGRTQIMNMYLNKGKNDKLLEMLPGAIEKIDNSLKKIIAVLEEMKEVSPIDREKFDSMSNALNIDDLIARRMEMMKDAGAWETTVES